MASAKLKKKYWAYTLTPTCIITPMKVKNLMEEAERRTEQQTWRKHLSRVMNRARCPLISVRVQVPGVQTLSFKVINSTSLEKRLCPRRGNVCSLMRFFGLPCSLFKYPRICTVSARSVPFFLASFVMTGMIRSPSDCGNQFLLCRSSTKGVQMVFVRLSCRNPSLTIYSL